MTPKAENALKQIAEVIFLALKVNASYIKHDVYLCVQKSLSKIFSDAANVTYEELIKQFKIAFELSLKEHHFVCRVSGFNLDDIELIKIGDFRLQKYDDSLNEELLSKYSRDLSFFKEISDDHNDFCVARASIFGTIEASQDKFFDDFNSVAALLTLLASVKYEGNTSLLRIHLMNQPDKGRGGARWLRYGDEENSGCITSALTKNFSFIISKADMESEFPCMLLNLTNDIFNKAEFSEVEDSIMRSLFWFKEASDETSNAVAFIKLWTCCEAFFSIKDRGMSEDNAVGVALFLVHGEYSKYSVADYLDLKKKIKKLYSLRSKIIHRGFIDSVSLDTRVDFSEIVGWVIVKMISLPSSGYTKLREVSMINAGLDSEINNI